MNKKLQMLCAMMMMVSLSAIAQTTYYVSATGTARGNGLSAQAPMRDLQKAIDAATDGSTILIAEGNYLGTNDRGYITVGTFANGSDKGKYLKLYGGYSADFSERDIINHVTKIQPGKSSASSMQGALLHITSKRNANHIGPQGEVVVDGITFDFGEVSMYCASDVYDSRTGTPNEGVLTGRLLEPGSLSVGKSVGYLQNDIYALHLDVEGDIKIQNCVFVNCRDYGIQGVLFQGKIEISNNLFVACRYSACQIQGNSSQADRNTLDFHHNTILFTWTRTKELSDMGQGFAFRNGICTINVYSNIFGYNTGSAVERIQHETGMTVEARKQCNLWGNYFVGNKIDLEISNGGEAIASVSADKISECEEGALGLKDDNCTEVADSKALTESIDQSYLKGYMSFKSAGSSRASGGNRTTMYCNKYPWEKVGELFGKIKGYGAQAPESKK